jgi:hypothetical protein
MSAAAQPLTAAAHLEARLKVTAATDTSVVELLSQLEASQCRALSVDAEQHMREKDLENRVDAPTITSSLPMSLALDEEKKQTTTTQSDEPSAAALIRMDEDLAVPQFEDANIRIIDMSVSPACEVSSITAFGLQWKPVGPRKTIVDLACVPLFASLVASTPTSCPCSHMIQFFSVESAAFSAPPSSELASYRQRMKQLPAALQSNQEAMEIAKQSGDLADVGALYLERERLEKEILCMRKAGPLAEDVIEVRHSMQLPIGMVTVDGKLYFLQHGIKSAQHCRVIAVQVHAAGRFKVSPFNEKNEDIARLPTGSDILTLQHTPALLRFFCGQRPRMKLLWSGKRDGMSPEEFHRRCDNQGPTLTVIRTRLMHGIVKSGQIIGGWAGESWKSNMQPCAAKTWLFSLGSALTTSSPPASVSKYRALSSVQDAIMGWSAYGPLFGFSAQGLHVGHSSPNANNQLIPNHCKLSGYELEAGYDSVASPIGGAEFFDIESIEVWSCPLQA